MKRILLILFIVLGSINLSAQRKADSATSQVWVGYYQDGERGALGVNKAEMYWAAAKYSGSTYEGRKLKAVRYYMRDTTEIHDVKLWVSTTLPASASKADVCCISLSKMKNGDEASNYNGTANDVSLPIDYTIPTEGVYVGLEMNITGVSTDGGHYPVVTSHYDTSAGGLYMKTTSYSTWYDYAESYGDLAMKLLLEGEFQQNSVSMSGWGTCYAPLGGSGSLDLTLQNNGTAGVSSIDYTITCRGVTSAEKHIAVSPSVTVFGKSFTVTLPLDADASAGTVQKTITITKVNGVANQSADNSATGNLVTVSKLYTKNVAVEEMTGTGCGYCPRGLKGMQLLRQQYGDRFVGIGLHWYNSDDYMYLNKSNYKSLSFSGAPACMVDRGDETDPYYGTSDTSRGIFNDFESAMKTVAVAEVSDISGHFNKDFGATVTADVTLEASVDGTYNLEFVTIGDSVYNTTARQNNYYYQYTASQMGSDLAQFASGGQYGKSSFAWAFDDVALCSSYTSSINQQSAVTLKAGVPQTVSFTMTMPTAETLTGSINYGKVAVVALLVDPTTGKIVNCAKSQYLDKSLYAGECGFCDGDGNVSSAANAYTELVDMKLDGSRFGITNYTDQSITKTVTAKVSTMSNGTFVFGTSENNVTLSSGEEKSITLTIPANGYVLLDATGWNIVASKTGSAKVVFTVSGASVTNTYTYSKTSWPFAFCKKTASGTSTASFAYSPSFTTADNGKIMMLTSNYPWGVKNQLTTGEAKTGKVTVKVTTLPTGKFCFSINGEKHEITTEGGTAEFQVTAEKSKYVLFDEAYWEPAPLAEKASAIVVMTTGDKTLTCTFTGEGGTGIDDLEATDASDTSHSYNLKGQRVGDGYHGIVISNGRKVLKK